MTLLTVGEFTDLHPSELNATALGLLLDAAEFEIVSYAGPVDSVTELFDGGYASGWRGRFLDLARLAASITSVNELYGWVIPRTLDTTDFSLHPDGYTLERLRTGLHTASAWGWRVEVVYVPVDDTVLRKVVQAGLVQLVTEYHPGVAAETIGSWTQQYRQTTDARASEHDALLGLLSQGSGLVVVGG